MKFGIIQGRLTQPIDGKIQCFPWGFWEQEFDTAQEIGINTIGFIFEEDRWQENPIWTEEGRAKLKQIMQRTGVTIDYLCADYFMEHPFVRVSDEEYQHTCKMLEEVMRRCAELGVQGIELPMVDNSKIDTEEERATVIETLKKFIPLMEELNMELTIESSLSPDKLKDTMEQLDHPLFGVTYDTGNSSSLGYDTTEEIESFGTWIRNIHIKDRLLHGTTVQLGTGDADFDKTFVALKVMNYSGPFTLQAARDGEAVENSKNQLAFLKSYIEKYLT